MSVLAGVAPGLVGPGSRDPALDGFDEERVLVLAGRSTRAREPCVGRDGLDAAGDEDVALAGLDGVVGHPGRLYARGAEPVDRRAGQVVVPGQDGDDPRKVGALLAGRLGAAPVEVLDDRRVELRHLLEEGPDEGHRQVIGADVLERSLEGAPNGGAGGRDDGGFGHEVLLDSGMSGRSLSPLMVCRMGTAEVVRRTASTRHTVSSSPVRS